MNYFDRLPVIRDAMLTWIGAQVAQGGTPFTPDPDVFVSDTGWQDNPPSEDELANACEWLKREDFVHGDSIGNGGLHHMTLTTKGERYLAEGRSVHDDPRYSQPAPAPYVVVSGNQGAAIAVNSAGVQQTVTNTDSFQAARDVAERIRAVSAGTAQEQDGNDLADQIEGELDSNSPDRGKLKALMFSVATAFAGALGSSVGADVAQLALQAHSVI